MVKRTKLEVYAFTYHGTMSEFADFIGITSVTLWKWIMKKAKPSKKNAQRVEKLTNGAITADYLRSRMD